MAASDMTFWMVQSHELKFWKTGHAIGSEKMRHSLLSSAVTSHLPSTQAIFSGIVGLSHVSLGRPFTSY